MIKKIILLVLATIPTLSYSQLNISQDSAFALLENNYLPTSWESQYNILISRDTLPSKTRIFSNDTSVVSPNEPSWFFFIDEYPFAEWWHPCKYIFIGANTGSSFVAQMQSTPEYEDFDELNILEPFVPVDTSDFFHSTYIDNGISSPNNYAVIINGGYEQRQNYPRYYNHCRAIYQTLVNVYHYDKNQIFVLMGNGLDTTRDYNNGLYNNNPVSYSPDLDGDGTADVQYAATLQNIVNVFNTLQQTITDNDNVFIFVTDHGGRGSTIALWNRTLMQPNQFAQQINKLNKAQVVNLCLVQCFSGGYTNLLARNNRVITTSCAANESAYAMRATNFMYSEFCYHWLSAVHGQTPDGSTTVDADYDGNGFITMNEAFLYAKEHDSWFLNGYTTGSTEHETPQFSSPTQPPLGNYLTLDSILRYYDFFLKDNIYDDGEEPDQYCMSGINDSPNLWLRRNNDNGSDHQIAKHGMRNYVYAKIHNRGPETSGATNWLQIYSKPSGIGNLGTNSWPNGWTLIGRDTIPRTAMGDSVVLCIGGTFPKLGGWPWRMHQNMNYTLLARIQSGIDIMTYPESSNTGFNVINNNNIACKNIVLSDAVWIGDGFADVAAVAMGNSNTAPTQFEFAFNCPDDEEHLNLISDADVRIVVDTSLGAALTAGTLYGMTRLNDTTFSITASDAIAGVTLRAGYSGYARLLVRYTNSAHGTLDQYDFNIIRMDVNTDETELLTVKLERPNSIAAWQAPSSPATDTITSISPNPNNGTFTLNYNIVTNGTASVVVQHWSGATLYSAPLNANATTHNINLSSPPTGAYAVMLMINGNVADTKTMIVY